MKFCPNCGTQLESEIRFCVSCGAKQPERVESASVSTVKQSAPKPERRPRNWRALLPLIRPGVAAIMALLMLIMAFLPIFNLCPKGVAETTFGLKDIKIKISAVQSVVFLFDTLEQLEDEDLYDSDLADEMIDLGEDLNDALEDELDDDEIEDIDRYSELPKKAQRIFNRLMICAMRIGMQSEQTATPYSLIVLAILSVLYLILALAVFASSVLHLLSALGLMKWAWCRKAPVGLFFALPVMLILVHFAMAFTFGESGVLVVGLAGAGVATIVFAAIALAMYVTYAVIERSFQNLRALLWRIPAVALSIALLATLGGSVFNARVKTYFGGKDTKSKAVIVNNVGFFNELILSDVMYDEVDEWSEGFYEEEAKADFEKAIEGFGDYTKREVERGEASLEHLDLLIYLGATHDFHDYMGIFGILPVLYLIVALGACLILWQNIVWLAGGKYSRGIVVSAKVISMVAMLLALGMAIAYVVINGIFIKAYIPVGYSLSIGAGVIASTVIALLAVFCPARTVSKRMNAEPVTEVLETTVAVENEI